MNLLTLTYKVLFLKDHFTNNIIKKFHFKIHMVDVALIIPIEGVAHIRQITL